MLNERTPKCRARASILAALFSAVLLFLAILLMGATPGSAGHRTVTAVGGNALGYWADQISLFGGNQADTGPTPAVALAPDASNSPQTASALCGQVVYGPAVLFTSDAITVSTEGSLGTTGSVETTSSIININKKTSTACTAATGSEIFTADQLSGTATATEAGATGSTTVVGGIVDTHSNSFNCSSLATPCGGHTHPADNPLTALDESLGQVAVPTNPAPNTAIEGHVHLSDTSTDSYVMVFNEQTVNPDGSITVNPVHTYYAARLAANPNGAYVGLDGLRYDIVRDPPYGSGGSILQGDLYLGQVTAGVTTEDATTTTTMSTTTTTVPPQSVADVGVDGTGPATAPISTRRVPSAASYTFTATNSGPEGANGTTLNIALSGARVSPSNVTSTDGTCTALKGKTKGVTCDFGTLAVGDTASVTFDVVAPTKPGTLTVTGTASTTSSDSNSANNADSVTTQFIRA